MADDDEFKPGDEQTKVKVPGPDIPHLNNSNDHKTGDGVENVAPANQTGETGKQTDSAEQTVSPVDQTGETVEEEQEDGAGADAEVNPVETEVQAKAHVEEPPEVEGPPAEYTSTEEAKDRSEEEKQDSEERRQDEETYGSQDDSRFDEDAGRYYDEARRRNRWMTTENALKTAAVMLPGVAAQGLGEGIGAVTRLVDGFLSGGALSMPSRVLAEAMTGADTAKRLGEASAQAYGIAANADREALKGTYQGRMLEARDKAEMMGIARAHAVIAQAGGEDLSQLDDAGLDGVERRLGARRAELMRRLSEDHAARERNRQQYRDGDAVMQFAGLVGGADGTMKASERREALAEIASIDDVTKGIGTARRSLRSQEREQARQQKAAQAQAYEDYYQNSAQPSQRLVMDMLGRKDIEWGADGLPVDRNVLGRAARALLNRYRSETNPDPALARAAAIYGVAYRSRGESSEAERRRLLREQKEADKAAKQKAYDDYYGNKATPEQRYVMRHILGRNDVDWGDNGFPVDRNVIYRIARGLDDYATANPNNADAGYAKQMAGKYWTEWYNHAPDETKARRAEAEQRRQARQQKEADKAAKQKAYEDYYANRADDGQKTVMDLLGRRDIDWDERGFPVKDSDLNRAYRRLNHDILNEPDPQARASLEKLRDAYWAEKQARAITPEKRAKLEEERKRSEAYRQFYQSLADDDPRKVLMDALGDIEIDWGADGLPADSGKLRKAALALTERANRTSDPVEANRLNGYAKRFTEQFAHLKETPDDRLKREQAEQAERDYANAYGAADDYQKAWFDRVNAGRRTKAAPQFDAEGLPADPRMLNRYAVFAKEQADAATDDAVRREWNAREEKAKARIGTEKIRSRLNPENRRLFDTDATQRMYMSIPGVGDDRLEGTEPGALPLDSRNWGKWIGHLRNRGDIEGATLAELNRACRNADLAGKWPEVSRNVRNLMSRLDDDEKGFMASPTFEGVDDVISAHPELADSLKGYMATKTDLALRGIKSRDGRLGVPQNLYDKLSGQLIRAKTRVDEGESPQKVYGDLIARARYADLRSRTMMQNGMDDKANRIRELLIENQQMDPQVRGRCERFLKMYNHLYDSDPSRGAMLPEGADVEMYANRLNGMRRFAKTLAESAAKKQKTAPAGATGAAANAVNPPVPQVVPKQTVQTTARTAVNPMGSYLNNIGNFFNPPTRNATQAWQNMKNALNYLKSQYLNSTDDDSNDTPLSLKGADIPTLTKMRDGLNDMVADEAIRNTLDSYTLRGLNYCKDRIDRILESKGVAQTIENDSTEETPEGEGPQKVPSTMDSENSVREIFGLMPNHTKFLEMQKEFENDSANASRQLRDALDEFGIVGDYGVHKDSDLNISEFTDQLADAYFHDQDKAVNDLFPKVLAGISARYKDEPEKAEKLREDMIHRIGSAIGKRQQEIDSMNSIAGDGRDPVKVQKYKEAKEEWDERLKGKEEDIQRRKNLLKIKTGLDRGTLSEEDADKALNAMGLNLDTFKKYGLSLHFEDGKWKGATAPIKKPVMSFKDRENDYRHSMSSKAGKPKSASVTYAEIKDTLEKTLKDDDGNAIDVKGMDRDGRKELLKNRPDLLDAILNLGAFSRVAYTTARGKLQQEPKVKDKKLEAMAKYTSPNTSAEEENYALNLMDVLYGQPDVRKKEAKTGAGKTPQPNAVVEPESGYGITSKTRGVEVSDLLYKPESDKNVKTGKKVTSAQEALDLIKEVRGTWDNESKNSKLSKFKKEVQRMLYDEKFHDAGIPLTNKNVRKKFAELLNSDENKDIKAWLEKDNPYIKVSPDDISPDDISPDDISPDDISPDDISYDDNMKYIADQTKSKSYLYDYIKEYVESDPDKSESRANEFASKLRTDGLAGLYKPILDTVDDDKRRRVATDILYAENNSNPDLNELDLFRNGKKFKDNVFNELVNNNFKKLIDYVGGNQKGYEIANDIIGTYMRNVLTDGDADTADGNAGGAFGKSASKPSILDGLSRADRIRVASRIIKAKRLGAAVDPRLLEESMSIAKSATKGFLSKYGFRG